MDHLELATVLAPSAVGAANTFPWQGCGEWLGLYPFCRYPENADLLMSVRPAATIEA